MRWLAPALVVATACTSSPGPATPRGARPLTAADVGLPETPAPDPRVPLQVASPAPAAPPPFYQRITCPPAHRGCVWSREITAQAVRTTLTCPHGAGYAGGQRLRWLDPGRLDVGGDDGLQRADVRRHLVAREDALTRCVAASTTTLAFRIAGVIAGGHATAVDVTGLADATCVRDAVTAIAFPRAPGPTTFAWELAYVVEDPAVHAAKPFRCP